MSNTDLEQTPQTTVEPVTSVVGVRFQPAGKPYHFLAPPELTLAANDWVVAETVYGEQVGQISHLPKTPPEDASSRKLRAVVRRASGLDMARYTMMQQRAARLMEVAREEAEHARLGLHVVSAEFTLDGENAILLCTGTVSKKDFAAFRRRVSSRMSCRVELRTIGPRDHAKALGGYGVCGEQRCCSRFLMDFQAVSIRMAKDQTISMAPSDITGMCGRLRCCLAYEHQVYRDEAKALPRIKSRVKTDHGIGRVIDLDILKGDIIVEIPPDGPRRERERFRYAADDVEVLPNNNDGS